MPKKTRKMKERAAMRRSLQTPTPFVGAESPETTSSAVPTRMRPELSSRAVAQSSFDYSYVYADLKRIALLAGFFFVVLIVLSTLIK